MKNLPTSAVTDITAIRDGLAVLDVPEAQAATLDQIRELEELAATAAAVQAKFTAVFEARRLNEEVLNEVPKAQWGNGLAAEIGLARRQSPARGGKYLNLARTLLTDLPHTYAVFQAGQVSEELAQIVVTETSWLSAKDTLIN